MYSNNKCTIDIFNNKLKIPNKNQWILSADKSIKVFE